jgi:hypothetical protein
MIASVSLAPVAVALALVAVGSFSRPQSPVPTDIKITFANLLDTSPPRELPSEALYPPTQGKAAAGIEFKTVNPGEKGTFAKLVSNNISGVTVTWVDPDHFNSQAQTTDLLRELLTSTQTTIYAFHVWSWVDAEAKLAASVQHRNGKQGRLVLWCPSPALYWAYQDGSGTWWWGSSPRHSCSPSTRPD